MIKIENLTKTFRTTEVETLALNKVSLEVRNKEFVAIMGPSGCGKSTLLNIMHCPDYFALLVMVIEARSMVDAQGQPLKYVPGESARTRLLWAEILHSGKLSPLGQSFIESLFFKRKAWAWWKSRVGSETEQDSPFLDLYRVAEQVVLEAFPKQEMLARLNTRLEGGDAHPLEAIVTRMLLTKVKLEPEDEDVDEPTPENHEEKNDEGEKPQSITSIIKISLTVLVIGYALGKIAMLFS